MYNEHYILKKKRKYTGSKEWENKQCWIFVVATGKIFKNPA